MQAGGRRFDPVILHHPMQTKACQVGRKVIWMIFVCVVKRPIFNKLKKPNTSGETKR